MPEDPHILVTLSSIIHLSNELETAQRTADGAEAAVQSLTRELEAARAERDMADRAMTHYQGCLVRALNKRDCFRALLLEWLKTARKRSTDCTTLIDRTKAALLEDS